MSFYFPALTVIGLLTCALAGCASGGAAAPTSAAADGGATSAGATSAAASPSASASASPATSAEASGSLSTKSVDCATVTRPKALKRTMAAPPVMCAYESATDYVSFAVAEGFARTFEQAAGTESKKIEQAPAEGWTFGAAWPVENGFTRVQYWLVAANGRVLLCKMGSERGAAGIKNLAAVCNGAKQLLYTA